MLFEHGREDRNPDKKIQYVQKVKCVLFLPSDSFSLFCVSLCLHLCCLYHEGYMRSSFGLFNSQENVQAICSQNRIIAFMYVFYQVCITVIFNVINLLLQFSQRFSLVFRLCTLLIKTLKLCRDVLFSLQAHFKFICIALALKLKIYMCHRHRRIARKP